MRGENIVCFSKDWGEAKTSNHHVLTELARHNRVLWVDSTATRTPSLGSPRDRRKMVEKMRAFLDGPRRVRDGLFRLTPLVFPWPHSAAARAVNRAVVAGTLQAATESLGFHDYQLWTFLPTVADYLDDARATVRVYYCVDEWSLFRGMDRLGIEREEARVLGRVDVVFATARALVSERARLHGNVRLARHGVDHRSFARALGRTQAIPARLAAIPAPRIGFFGTLDDWFDADLVAELARRKADWSFVLVGPERTSMDVLRPLRNVHRLGPVPHEALPDYAAGFAVGIVPYRGVERMRFVDPLKVREYLAAGLPVVATPLPELEDVADVRTAASVDEFQAAVERAIATDDSEMRCRRSASMASETWERRVASVGAAVLEAKEKPCRTMGSVRRQA